MAARSVQRARERAPGVYVRHVLAYWVGPEDPHTLIADWMTELIRDCPEGWIFGLDDDNIMHPDFLSTLAREVEAHPSAWAFLFGMDYPQFSRGILRPMLPPRTLSQSRPYQERVSLTGELDGSVGPPSSSLRACDGSPP